MTIMVDVGAGPSMHEHRVLKKALSFLMQLAHVASTPFHEVGVVGGFWECLLFGDRFRIAATVDVTVVTTGDFG